MVVPLCMYEQCIKRFKRMKLMDGAAGILVNGIGLELNYAACATAITLCVAFYSTSKVSKVMKAFDTIVQFL